jgi:hypothetical protein
MGTISPAANVFRGLDTNKNGRLEASEVTFTKDCDGDTRLPVADLVGLNQDQFIGVLKKKAVPQTVIDTASQQIDDATIDKTHTLGARIAAFFEGLGAILLGIILLPFELIGWCVELGLTAHGTAAEKQAGRSLPWLAFLGGAALIKQATGPAEPPNERSLTRTREAFLSDQSVSGQTTCPP